MVTLTAPLTKRFAVVVQMADPNLGPGAEPERVLKEQSLIVELGMPERFVLARHGESQANIVQRGIKDLASSGASFEYPHGYLDIPDREFHLSKLGREQTHSTGRWLAQAYPEGFDAVQNTVFV